MTLEDKKKLNAIYQSISNIAPGTTSTDEILRQSVKIYLYEKYHKEDEQ